MISHQHKCIFVEVPRTGSTSVRKIVGKSKTPHLNIWQIRNELRHTWSHDSRFLGRMGSLISLLGSEQKRIDRGDRIFDSYYKFGFVRNPWDRVVSLYLRNKREHIRASMQFNEFVERIEYSSATCYHPVPHRNQLDWFVNPDGEVMVDFIGRFERISEDWATVSRHLGLESSKLPHKNKKTGGEKHYTEWYTPHTIDCIRRKFSVDIDYFEYDFES